MVLIPYNRYHATSGKADRINRRYRDLSYLVIYLRTGLVTSSISAAAAAASAASTTVAAASAAIAATTAAA
jgi:hypothetical protein